MRTLLVTLALLSIPVAAAESPKPAPSASAPAAELSVADALILASDTGQLRALILNLEDSPRSIRFTGTINDTIEVPPLSLTSTDLIRSAL